MLTTNQMSQNIKDGFGPLGSPERLQQLLPTMSDDDLLYLHINALVVLPPVERRQYLQEIADSADHAEKMYQSDLECTRLIKREKVKRWG